jgi:signal transduction histidine kinase
MIALVLRNLINNAIKFTPENGLITIAAVAQDDQLLVSVSDNGVGLSKSQITNFNEASIDEHAQSTLGTNKEKGTGIGLMLCKTFTKLMNGTLQVQSEQNVGTTFTLALPSGLINS